MVSQKGRKKESRKNYTYTLLVTATSELGKTDFWIQNNCWLQNSSSTSWGQEINFPGPYLPQKQLPISFFYLIVQRWLLKLWEPHLHTNSYWKIADHKQRSKTQYKCMSWKLILLIYSILLELFYAWLACI
jgi:hypothetical protein